MQIQSMAHIEDTNVSMESSHEIEEILDQVQQIMRNTNYYESIRPMRNMQCSICVEIKPENSFVYFCSSGHSFCQECVNALVINAIKEFQIAKCPIESCPQQFNENSPHFFELSEQNKEKYSKMIRNRKILSNPKIRLCSKPGCEGHYLTNAPKLQCSACKEQYCERCLSLFHTGSCDRLVARGMEKKFGFRKCPQCQMVVSRQDGCDHMTCYCTHQFCYKCGQSYIHGQHACTKPPHLKGFAALRWEIERKPSALEVSGLVNLSKILYLLEPGEEKSAIYRLIYIFLFTIIVYPVLSLLAITGGLLVVTVYCGLAVVVISGYFLLLPIMEVSNLQLAPARFMRHKDVPTILIRILVLPLYPVNFLYGIKDKADFLTCDGEIPRGKSVLKIVFFFLALPFLMSTGQE